MFTKNKPHRDGSQSNVRLCPSGLRHNQPRRTILIMEKSVKIPRKLHSHFRIPSKPPLPAAATVRKRHYLKSGRAVQSLKIGIPYILKGFRIAVRGKVGYGQDIVAGDVTPA